ncbi:unnamed protein product [Sphagnum jensenii]
MPWIEKYRPSSLSELVSHENILSTLMRFVNEDSLPNLLFYGPPGTGKTSTIIALARQMYKDDGCAVRTATKYQRCLSTVIEKSEKHVRFCFISNYAEKIIPALQSRCIRFKFKRIPFELARPRIREICSKENVNISEEAVKAAFDLCEGDMRRVVNMLQSLSLSLSLNHRQLTVSDVYEVTGNPSPERMKGILEILLQKNPSEALASKLLG